MAFTFSLFYFIFPQGFIVFFFFFPECGILNIEKFYQKLLKGYLEIIPSIHASPTLIYIKKIFSLFI